jgi:hypothetical protein
MKHWKIPGHPPDTNDRHKKIHMSAVVEGNARPVDSCDGSVVRVEVELMLGIQFGTRTRVVEYEMSEERE